MNLYLLSQTVNNNYDTYDSCVVAAESEDAARRIHPCGRDVVEWWNQTWVDVKDVKIEYIGTAKEGTERSVILASFNAG